MKYLATIENLIEKHDEPDHFEFDLGPIIYCKKYGELEMVEEYFGDKNFHKSYHALKKQFPYDMQKKLWFSKAYTKMYDLVNNQIEKLSFHRMNYTSLSEALVSLELKGYSLNDITIIND